MKKNSSTKAKLFSCKGETVAELLVALSIIILAVAILSGGAVCCAKILAASTSEDKENDPNSNISENVTVDIKLIEYGTKEIESANDYSFSADAILHSNGDSYYYTVVK